jgi:hypothetical protein
MAEEREQILQDTSNVDLSQPLGTLDEIKAVGFDPSRTGSCSEPHKKNIGCSHFHSCRFTSWRDNKLGQPGPINIGIRRAFPPALGGKVNEMQSPCFGWYREGHSADQQDSPKSGITVQIIAYQGDGKTIKERCSRSTSPKDGQIEHYIHEHVVTPFARPSERFGAMKFSQEAREVVMDDVEREALAEAMRHHGQTQPPKKVRPDVKPG